MSEFLETWTLDELIDAHDVLDMEDELQEEEAKASENAQSFGD